MNRPFGLQILENQISSIGLIEGNEETARIGVLFSLFSQLEESKIPCSVSTCIRFARLHACKVRQAVHQSWEQRAMYRRGRVTSDGRGEDEGDLERAGPRSTVFKPVEQNRRHCRELEPDSSNELDTQYVLTSFHRWTTGRPHIEAPTPALKRSVGKRTSPSLHK